jgi:nitrogen regulatory protein PII
MDYRKITAMIRREAISKVVANLKEIGVRGMTVTKIEGFGEHAALYPNDRLVPGIKIEIFAHKNMVKDITEVIMAIAHTGRSGDGIVAVYPVEELYRIQTRATPAQNSD